MTFEDKAAIVISQLREDRDRLQHNIDKIKTEIVEAKKVEHIPLDVERWDYTRGLDRALSIIDKYREDKEFDREYGEI